MSSSTAPHPTSPVGLVLGSHMPPQDIVGMARPVVKAAFQARTPAEVPGLVAEAFRGQRMAQRHAAI